MAATFLGVAAAAEVTDSLELGAFAPFEPETESPYEADQFVPTPYGTPATQSTPSTDMDDGISDRPARQFYVSGIIGGSFFALTPDDSPSSSLTAGGAMGVACGGRPSGAHSHSIQAGPRRHDASQGIRRVVGDGQPLA